MAAAILSSAVLAALLLSPAGAGADQVTWRKCKDEGCWGRVLEASPDSEATTLWLATCSLTEVRSGDFDGLHNVKTIMLNSNFIAHVDPAAFRTVPKLRWLYLIRNDLREVPVFDEHSCPSLIELHLSYNRITEINHPRTFSGCTELQEIYMSYNVIEYIQTDVFRPLSKLTRLDVSNNKLTALPETLFIKNSKLYSLNLIDNQISYLPANFVSKLKNAGALLRSFFFHGNSWHCACLLELLADVKRAGLVSSSEYGRPVCVYSGAYPCCRPAHSGLLGRAGTGPRA